MPEDKPHDAQSELATLQRQTLAKLSSLVRVIQAPRRIEITRDDSGAITGARSVVSEDEILPNE